LIALLQRVKKASVKTNGAEIASIQQGLLVFVAFSPNDSNQQLNRMAERVLTYRVFADSKDKMNKSLLDKNFELLVVPQFTLAADTRSGTRPSFLNAAQPEISEKLFLKFTDILKSKSPNIKSGKFKANMQVSLINDGPVTFWLEVN
jgi:D-tyrosyl-tRNA(Tyr) deacylase